MHAQRLTITESIIAGFIGTTIVCGAIAAIWLLTCFLVLVS